MQQSWSQNCLTNLSFHAFWYPLSQITVRILYPLRSLHPHRHFSHEIPATLKSWPQVFYSHLSWLSWFLSYLMFCCPHWHTCISFCSYWLSYLFSQVHVSTTPGSSLFTDHNVIFKHHGPLRFLPDFIHKITNHNCKQGRALELILHVIPPPSWGHLSLLLHIPPLSYSPHT